MLWWLVIIGGFALGFYFVKEATWGSMSFVDYVAAFILGTVASLVGLMIVVLLVFIPETETKFKEKIEITALKDNSQIQGNFFLGSGSINEESYYFYMTNTNKGKKMEKAKVENSYINENSDNDTYVEVYDVMIKNGFAKFLFGKTTVDSEYIFYVPEDSVTTEFKVDME